MRETLEPEVLRVELTGAVLALKAFGVVDPRGFSWITAPPEDRIAAAERTLAALGATEREGGRITPIGRRLAGLPLDPRIGRILLEAERRGIGGDGALVAAVAGVGGGSRRPSSAPRAGRSDLLDLLDEFQAGPRGRAVRDRGDRAARWAEAVERERRALVRLVAPGRPARDDDLLKCVLAGFPDAVGRRRESGSDEVLLANGGGARLDRTSSVRDAELIVAVERRRIGRERTPRITIASEAREEWLEELFPQALREEIVTVWDDRRGRATGRRIRRFLDLPIRDLGSCDPDPDAARALLLEAATHPREIDALRRRGLDEHLRRIEAAASEGGAGATIDDRLVAECVAECASGLTGLCDLDPRAVASAIAARVLGPSIDLDRLVPRTIRLPSGRSARIDYGRGRPPRVQARIQEMFGSVEAPRILGGRRTVAVDLLAPNGRSVQITEDLGGFWRDLYPRIRRELMRRYPRHPWPEDPVAARPTSRPLPRKRRG